MSTLLESLHELQNIETKLWKLQEKVERKKRSVSIHGRKLTELDQRIEAKHAELQGYKRTTDALELDVNTREADISRLRENLNRAKTNKEYSALLTQINTAKADNLKIEERILEHMSKFEDTQKAEERLQTEHDQVARRVEELRREKDAYSAEVADELASLQSQREKAAETLPASVIHIFNRVAKKHEGEALARIEKPDPRSNDYMCEGCNMSVTTELVNSLMIRNDIQLCQNCGRILYLDTQPV